MVRMADSSLTENERFVEVDFYDTDLDGRRFVSCRFNGCDFTEKTMAATVFEGCAFFNCRFNDAQLEQVAFTGCTLSDCGFFMATLAGCKLSGSTFADCSWTHAVVRGGQWPMVTMRQAKLDGLDLSDVRLAEADLSEGSPRPPRPASAPHRRAALRFPRLCPTPPSRGQWAGHERA